METKLKTLREFLKDFKESLNEISKMKLEDIKDEFKCKHFFTVVRDMAITYKALNYHINDVLKPSTFHKSAVIKRLIISNIRDRCFSCEEVTIGRSRFDVLAITRHDEKPKVIGYEIKTDKSDLKRDDKFESYLNHCNILYFVVPVELVNDAKEKISKSRHKKHIGIYAVDDNGNLKLEKRASSNKKEFDLNKIKETIIYSGYNRYVYS